MLLGKYQYVRSRELQLQEATLENPTKGGVLSMYDYVAWDGKNYAQKILGTVLSSGDNTVNYGFGSPVGVNHSLLVIGCFNSNTIQLKFNIHGRM
jgi:hypothetical protein